MIFNTVQDVKNYINDKVKEHLSNENVTVEYSNRLARVLGKCREQRNVFGGKRFTLIFNTRYIEQNYKSNAEHVKNTVLHEIAHALAGAKHHHDYVWQRICIEIGGSGKRGYKRNDINMVKINYKNTYIYECPHCHRLIKRNRKVRKGLACGECCRKYNNGNYSKDYIFVLKETLQNA